MVGGDSGVVGGVVGVRWWRGGGVVARAGRGGGVVGGGGARWWGGGVVGGGAWLVRCLCVGLVDGGVVPASSNPNLLPSPHAPFLVFDAMIYDFV